MSTKPTNEARAEIAEHQACICHPMGVFGEGRKTRAWFHRKDCPLHDAEDAARVSQQFNAMFVVAPAPSPAAADAGDARKVVEALEKIVAAPVGEGMEPSDFSKGYTNVSCDKCEDVRAIANEALSAARRLLDAPPGVGERMREAIDKLLGAMEMQEKRERGEFHIPGETMLCIWKDAQEFARAALAAPAPAEGARAKAEASETVGPRNITTPPRWDEYDTYRLAGGNLGYDEWLAASAPAGGVATGEGGE